MPANAKKKPQLDLIELDGELLNAVSYAAYFNRIPLFKKLKFREAFGFNMLYGNLSDKNNPYKNPDDSFLFRFPERNGQQTSFVMNHMPYMEFTVGIHNILNFIHIDYVRRLTYLDHPGINKHGVRLMMMVLF